MVFPLLTPISRATVYRLKPRTTTDTYGDTVEDWDNPERTVLRGAVVQSPKPAEDGTALLTAERNLYVEGRVYLAAADRIEVDGEVWEVQGTPRFRRGLVGAGYTTAELRFVERRTASFVPTPADPPPLDEPTVMRPFPGLRTFPSTRLFPTRREVINGQ